MRPLPPPRQTLQQQAIAWKPSDCLRPFGPVRPIRRRATSYQDCPGGAPNAAWFKTYTTSDTVPIKLSRERTGAVGGSHVVQPTTTTRRGGVGAPGAAGAGRR